MRRYIILGLTIISLGACATKPVAVYDMGAMSPVTISPGMTRRHVTADQSTMAIYDLKRGAYVPMHQHSSEQLSYVQQGRLRFIAGGRAYDVRRGELIVIPPNVPHSIEALENSIEYDFFAPPRWTWSEDRDEGAVRTESLSGPPGSRLP
jgi:quercetin dioxygenase-like cupin family protein